MQTVVSDCAETLCRFAHLLQQVAILLLFYRYLCNFYFINWASLRSHRNGLRYSDMGVLGGRSRMPQRQVGLVTPAVAAISLSRHLEGKLSPFLRHLVALDKVCSSNWSFVEPPLHLE